MRRLKEIEVQPGGVMIWDRQPYRCEAVTSLICSDGHEVPVSVWRSWCPECGEEFAILIRRGGKFSPNRRCPDHHRPGVPVNRKQAKRRPASR